MGQLSLSLEGAFSPSTNKDLSTDLKHLLAKISELTLQASNNINAAQKKARAQYFSPIELAKQMSAMMTLRENSVIGDYGAGTGILSSTVLACHYHKDGMNNRGLSVDAYEVDTNLHEVIKSVFEHTSFFSKGLRNESPRLTINDDFTSIASHLFSGKKIGNCDSIILNPPYKKLNQSTPLAKLFRANDIPVPNLYAAFIVLSVLMLKDKGELVAIVPRSFCSGPYFKNFRKWLLNAGGIDWLVRYRQRSNIFRGDNVLQENVVFRFTKGIKTPDAIKISLCDSPDADPEFEGIIPQNDVFPPESDFIYVPGDIDELNALHELRSLPYTLDQLSLRVNTGKFEDFRNREKLFSNYSSGRVPVLYSQHWSRGEHTLNWCAEHVNKPAWFEVNEKDGIKLIPAGCYVAIKRISTNSDSSGRCHASILTKDSMPGELWAIDNHIQLISGKDKMMTESEAIRLCEYLSTPLVDKSLRMISGTTQINCNDIRQLRFPSIKDQLV